MPRKDLTKERTEQILDALEHCVERFGIGGTSLEQVAQEAGVKRSLIRHYIGNREDLILAMAKRLTTKYASQMRWLADSLRGPKRIDSLLNALFPKEPVGSFRDVIVVEQLIAAAPEFPEIRGLMTSLVEGTIEGIRDQLGLAYPGPDPRTAWTIAHGVVGIYFNHHSLAPLQLPSRHRTAARFSARALIETLDAS